jgi:hypothetical protein
MKGVYVCKLHRNEDLRVMTVYLEVFGTRAGAAGNLDLACTVCDLATLSSPASTTCAPKEDKACRQLENNILEASKSSQRFLSHE